MAELHGLHLEPDGGRLRPVPARDAPARGRRLRPGHRAAAQGGGSSSPRRPRSARRSAAPTSARASSRRRAAEFEAVVERAPTNDYALFCLGRALMELRPPGRRAQAARAGRRTCARTAATTGSTATARAPRGVTAALRCYNVATAFAAPVGPWLWKAGEMPAFLLVKTPNQ